MKSLPVPRPPVKPDRLTKLLRQLLLQIAPALADGNLEVTLTVRHLDGRPAERPVPVSTLAVLEATAKAGSATHDELAALCGKSADDRFGAVLAALVQGKLLSFAGGLYSVTRDGRVAVQAQRVASEEGAHV